jgi:RHS repeat-associated protein
MVTIIPPVGDTIITTTWYVRDATGNIMSTYFLKEDTVKQDEIHLYGSSRLGIIKPERFLRLADTTVDNQYGDTSGTISLLGTWRGGVFTRGKKFFELSNHLGNVLVTISDRKQQVSKNDTLLNYYMPDVVTANDYYPFGMLMVGRKYSSMNSYRYGFNGKENDNEVKGEGAQQDYGMRFYDPRLGKFLSVDPLASSYPWYTPYQFAGDTPVWAIDVDGLEPKETSTLDKPKDLGGVFVSASRKPKEGTTRSSKRGGPSGNSGGALYYVTEYYHRGSSTYGSKKGWYDLEDYANQLSINSSGNGNSPGLDLVAVGINVPVSLSTAASHTIGNNPEERIKSFLNEIGDPEPAFFGAMGIAAKR